MKTAPTPVYAVIGIFATQALPRGYFLPFRRNPGRPIYQRRRGLLRHRLPGPKFERIQCRLLPS